MNPQDSENAAKRAGESGAARSRTSDAAIAAESAAVQHELALLQRSVEAGARRIAELEARVANPELHTRAVSRVLPQAIAIRSRQDHALSDALEPTVESALRSAVRDDPKLLADAIYPIIGPAIRKSLFNALNSLLQRVDRAREQSLTLHGLAWRWEAIRTGRPFAEVVLVKSLIFRVEQVFLIHRETGLLLQHVVASGVAVKDAQMISGMLSAIQEFVRDSFQAGGGETLQLLRVGELTIAVEQGPLAIVAVVVRGVPPADLRAPLQDVVEKIHAEMCEELESFRGDAAPFIVVRSLLERCLVERKREPTRGIALSRIVSWLVLIAAALFVVRYLAVLGMVRIERDRLVDVLDHEPGYAVLSTRIDLVDRVLHVHAVRDPLARDWQALLEEASVDPRDVVMHWTLYESLDPSILLARAKEILEPPDSVTLNLENGVLHASGGAPHRWIARASTIAVAMPGIRAFDSKALADAAGDAVLRAKRSIEAMHVEFQAGSTTAMDQAAFAKLRDAVQEADKAAQGADLFVHVRVIGAQEYSAQNGTALARARVLCTALEARPLVRVRCSASASSEPRGAETRAASFSVDLLEPASVPEEKR